MAEPARPRRFGRRGLHVFVTGMATALLSAWWLAAALAAGATPATVAHELAVQVESQVFGRRGEAVLTHADLDAYMIRIPRADRAAVLSDPQRIGTMIDNLSRTRLLATEALKDGLLEDPEIQAFLYHASMQYLADQQLERVKDAGELDDYTQQARELYLRDPEAWSREELADFTHLLITTEDRSDDEARALIDEIAGKLEQGTAFGALIRDYSEDPGASRNHGRFQGVPVESLDPDFAAALRELAEPGEFSEPVRSYYGWHIIRLDSYQPAGVPEFEEIADELAERARRDHRRRIEEQYVRRLMAEPLELEDGAVEKLLERYPATDDLSFMRRR